MRLRVEVFAGGVNLSDARGLPYVVLTRDEAIDLATALGAELKLPPPYIPRQSRCVRFCEWWRMRFPTPERRQRMEEARLRAARMMGILKP